MSGDRSGGANPYLTEPPVEDSVRKRKGLRLRRPPLPVVLSGATALIVGALLGYAAASGRSGAYASIYRESPGSLMGRLATPLVPGSSDPGSLAARASIPDSYTPLFTRQRNGVTVRAFLDGGSETVSGASQGCMNGPPVVVEASTSKMVGVSVSWEPSSSELYPANSVVRAEVLGSPEGDPIAVIMVAAGPRVKEVKATFSTSDGLSDSMTPVYGWAVLAAPIAAVPSPSNSPIGRVQSLGSGGQVLASVPLVANVPVTAWFGYAPSCVLPSNPPASTRHTGH